ncbi:uncharacterized protein LOC130892386 [Diorhabda carinulata]|uniref:uncharacterized protein LOC130446029 n=1 Tax=Diorhabda sublineata TaxID=1163346 RepID=UPI0024E06288|nr:uncharacterized protein LOC130446029 [Diorhabda sublineata]XP_057653772.1 uncharacterized protein LOC130892386 [Diorhabda carinulata]
MYAAAGGASLASRQARQKQKQNKQKQQKQIKATELSSKPPQAKNFQNYTDPLVPRLSRVERGTLKPAPPNERRHSTSNYHLKEPQHRSRIRESPSISIPVQNIPAQPLSPQHHPPHLPLLSTPSLQGQLPQICIPEDGNLERRCSFVRQVEEMEKHQEQGLLNNCNHICNVDFKEKQWDDKFYMEYDRSAFGSLEYPFSECSQGRAAWQERERDRRCSLSEEARQHRIKQTEAHHRWMKRNRIHDSSYGVGSDEDDFFSVYHQSAAANALLYVGLGTTAIGSVIFFVGTGEKGFKTLELRLIGPTLIACGLLCCLIRVLLCAVPSTCFRNRKKTRLKANACPHGSNKYLTSKFSCAHDADFVKVDKTSHRKSKKKVSIVPPNHSLPSTSTAEYKELPQSATKISIPEIHLPSSFSEEGNKSPRDEDSIIELQTLDLVYDIQSLSSSDSASETKPVIVTDKNTSKFMKSREPENITQGDNTETCLSVVLERNDNSESSDGDKEKTTSEKHTHSGIVLSPLQLGQ